MIHKFKHNTPLFIIITVYILISFLFVNKIGYYYDEVLYAPSMFTPCSSNSFNYLVIKFGNFCLPILSMGYIGSLKTYLFTPFTIIGISNTAYIYRGLSIVFGALGIFYTYKIVEKLKLQVLTIVTVLILFALNPSFILGTVFDWGPVSISIFLKTIFIYFSLKFIEKSENNISQFLISLFPLLIISLVGVFNKLDFVFFLIPFYFAILIDKKVRTLLYQIAKNYLQVLVVLLFAAITILSLTLYMLKEKILLFMSAESISKVSFGQKTDNLYQVLIGTSVPHVITNVLINSPFEAIIFITLLLVFIYGLYNLTKNKYNLAVSQKFVLFGGFFYYLIILFFGKSGGPHHMIATFPVIFLIFGLLINRIIKNKNGKILIYFFMAVYVANSFFILAKTNQLFEKGVVRPSWSKSLLEVSIYLKNELPDKKVYATDWGISNQLIIYSKGKVGIEEPFRPISEIQSKQVQEKIESVDTENTVAIRFYNSSVFTDATKNFPYDKYENSKIFYDNEKPTFIIYY